MDGKLVHINYLKMLIILRKCRDNLMTAEMYNLQLTSALSCEEG